MTLLSIDVPYLSETLEGLLKIPSPTGYTDEIVRHVCKELERLGVFYELTRRGAIRARLEGKDEKPARAFVSHLDTLGAQVKALKDNGRLEVVPIGCWSARFAEGARTTIFTDSGAYTGTILSLKASGHTFNTGVDEFPIGWEFVELRVDAYARTKDDLKKLGVDVGDIVSIDPQSEFLDNGFIVSRHLDNKAGVAVMLAALKAFIDSGVTPTVDIYWLFTIAEETGHGASAILPLEVASLVAIDNGTSAPGQNSEEFGVTIAMGDQTGPFDYHLTRKIAQLCQDNAIKYQKDVFRYYRSDAASAVEAGADVRTALITFGIDASHGYERIHMHALRSLAELATVYATSTVEITRDASDFSDLEGFTSQPTEDAEQVLTPDTSKPQSEPQHGPAE